MAYKANLEWRRSGVKTCRTCGRDKPLSGFDFHKVNKILKSGRTAEYDVWGPSCKPCNRENARVTGKNKRRNARRVEKYGSSAAYRRYTRFKLTKGDVDRIISEQGMKCAVCFDVFPDGKQKSLDHDHVSGRARGFVCNRCNLFLGMIENRPEIYLLAMSYLKLHEERNQGTAPEVWGINK